MPTNLWGLFAIRTATTLVTLIIGSNGWAGSYPAGFSIFAPAPHIYWQAPSPDSAVCGVRLGIIRSLNDSVCGLDIGVLISQTKEKFSGIAISGLANIVDGDSKVYFLQAAGFINRSKGTKVLGFQIAGATNQIQGDGSVIGMQAAILGNWNPKTNIYGLQIGVVNRAAKVVGIQAGLCNIAEHLAGIQIGLANFNQSADPFFFLPGINIGF